VEDYLDLAEEKKADKADFSGGQGDRFIPSEYRIADTPRRADEDRRQAEEGIEVEEGREPPPRREPFDRRSMGLEVVFGTTGSITKIEDWLDDHCKSGWQVVL